MQHHNGIFRSDDAGSAWTEIAEVSPSSFGFAVAVHPRDPDTAWFIPATMDEQRFPVDARLVVTRTRDAGASFEVLSRGLPDEPAYDLVASALRSAARQARSGSARTRRLLADRQPSSTADTLRPVRGLSGRAGHPGTLPDLMP